MSKSNPKNNRLQTAMEIRNVIVPALRITGQSVGGMLIGYIAGYSIWHRTPFNMISRFGDHSERFLHEDRRKRLPSPLPHGLDIWGEAGKVFNLEWDHKDRLLLVTFRRGTWERTLIETAIHLA